MKCEKCGSDRLIEGRFQGNYATVFVEKGTENKLFPKAFPVKGKACLACGAIFDLKISSTKRNKVGDEEQRQERHAAPLQGVFFCKFARGKMGSSSRSEENRYICAGKKVPQ